MLFGWICTGKSKGAGWEVVVVGGQRGVPFTAIHKSKGMMVQWKVRVGFVMVEPRFGCWLSQCEN